MSFCMDNFELKLEASGREAFKKALEIVFMNHKSVSRYKTENDNMSLYWHKEGSPLPYEMQFEETEAMLWKWLTTKAEYPPEPDIDGSVSKGFRIESGSAMNGSAWDYGAVRVTAVWAQHHK